MGNTEYTLHAVMGGQSAGGIAFYDSSKQYISGTQINNVNKTDHTFTTPSNAAYMRFWDNDGKMPWNEVMLVYGSTAPTAYAPYTGTTKSIVFPDEVGTVYGGSLDVVSGVLTVEWQMKSALWGSIVTGEPNETTGYYHGILEFSSKPVAITQNAKYGVDVFCNVCNTVMWQGAGRTPEHFYAEGNDNKFHIYSNWDNSTEVAIAVKLATPHTIQLTPTQVNALLGDNVIWSDTNGTNTAKYLKKG